MTKFEIVVPCEWGKDIFDGLCKVVEANSREWAFSRHIPDEHCSFEHWHLGGLLHSNRVPQDIYSWLVTVTDKVKLNSVEKIRKHWKTYLTYIMHQTKEALALGKSAPTEYGGSADIEGALSDYKTIGECDKLISDILAGNILEYQFHQRVDLVEEIIRKGWYVKVKQAFESADKNRLNKTTSMVEERKQCWIFGKAGSGKTELAKWYCRSAGYADIDIYVTSSGQNPFDDYKGQPCVIVDDIDADTMTPKTALKLADCFTGSAVKARYSNKVIFAKMVVFTSTVAPQSWWKSLANDKVDGNVYQLLRRLNMGSWHITDTSVEMTLYDGQGEIDKQITVSLPQEIVDKVNSRRNDRSVAELLHVFNVAASDSTGNKFQASVDMAAGTFEGSFSVPFVDQDNQE